MKNFIKKPWFPLLVAILIIAVVAFVMALFGWRITYAPDLENSWDAISAVATWAGVIASFVAIMVAIWIPKRIADQQNKIAVFDKRMQCYMHLQKHFNFCAVISPEKSPIETFEWAFMNYLHEVADHIEMLMVLKEVSNRLYQMPFLFSDIDEKEIDEIYFAFLNFMNKILSNKKWVDELQLYQEAIHNFQQKHLENIQKSLVLYEE